MLMTHTYEGRVLEDIEAIKLSIPCRSEHLRKVQITLDDLLPFCFISVAVSTTAGSLSINF